MFGMVCRLARAAEMQDTSKKLHLGELDQNNFIVSDPIGYGLDFDLGQKLSQNTI